MVWRTIVTKRRNCQNTHKIIPQPPHKFGADKREVKDRTNRRERLALRNKVKEEEHLEIFVGSREEVAMNMYLHGPMDYAKTLKLRLRVGDLDLPERRKRLISSREEGKEDAKMCPCGKSIESKLT